jgi:GTPase SAR1 family protein
VEKVSSKQVSLVVWDIGGPDKIRSLWKIYLTDISAIIWVIDRFACKFMTYRKSNDRERIGESGTEIIKILNLCDSAALPVLIFANKQDLPNAMTPYESMLCGVSSLIYSCCICWVTSRK